MQPSLEGSCHLFLTAPHTSLPQPTLVTVLASSLLVSWAFFLGSDDPQEMESSYMLSMVDEKPLAAPGKGIIEPQPQGHFASASSVPES